MPYQILVTPEFESQLKKLDSQMVLRIQEKIEELAEHPELLRYPLKHLPADLKGLHKYRVGDYRLLLWPDHKKKQLVLYAVAHRREIYREI